MKKTTLKTITLALATGFVLGCGNTNNNNTATNEGENQISETTETTKITKPQTDFSKFDHYLTLNTKNAVIQQFGAENIKHQTMYFAEGTVEKKASVLTNPQNGHIVHFIWQDNNDSLDWIEANYLLFDENYEPKGKQKIEAENGLYLGMPLKKLKEWNGADIKFSGFAWDYGGSVFREEGTRIASSPVMFDLDLENYNGADFAMGDIELTSADPKVAALDIIISAFSMYPKK